MVAPVSADGPRGAAGLRGVPHTLVHNTIDAIVVPQGARRGGGELHSIPATDPDFGTRMPDRVRIGLVPPDVMGTYGDSGNAVVLRQRLRLRGIPPRDRRDHAGRPGTGLARPLHPRRRGGPRATAGRQTSSLPSGFAAPAASALRCLAICAASRYSATGMRPQPAKTSRGRRSAGRDDYHRAGEAHHPRSGLKLVRRSHPALTGFENHRGTVLGPDARRSRRSSGAGNRDGDGYDAAVQGSVVATYLHGPCLACAIRTADLLLSRVVGELPPHWNCRRSINCAATLMPPRRV